MPLLVNNDRPQVNQSRTAVFSLEGMTGQNCVKTTEEKLLAVNGVLSVTVKLLTQQLVVKLVDYFMYRSSLLRGLVSLQIYSIIS